jgi:hypothetical protein
MEGLCMIKLYHGSNVNIDSIDLSKGHKGKDFGKQTKRKNEKSTFNRTIHKESLLGYFSIGF